MRVAVIVALILAWLLVAWLCVVTPRQMRAASNDGRPVAAVQQTLFDLSSGVRRYWYGVIPVLLVVTGAAISGVARRRADR